MTPSERLTERTAPQPVWQNTCLAYSGFLIEKEVKFLGDALEKPERPFVAIMGGAKVGDKIPVIENLIKKVDCLIIGGGMSYTFFKAMGYEIGKSILDEESIELAAELMKSCRSCRC